jgi:hypothetical protein
MLLLANDVGSEKQPRELMEPLCTAGIASCSHSAHSLWQFLMIERERNIRVHKL